MQIEIVESLPTRKKKSKYRPLLDRFVESGAKYAHVTSECDAKTLCYGINSYTGNNGIPVRALIRNGELYLERGAE